jgi:hypothetical protein
MPICLVKATVLVTWPECTSSLQSQNLIFDASDEIINYADIGGLSCDTGS